MIAAFSDGLNQEDPEPHDVGTLGDYVEELLEVLPTPGSASSGAWRRIVSAQAAPPGWR